MFYCSTKPSVESFKLESFEGSGDASPLDRFWVRGRCQTPNSFPKGPHSCELIASTAVAFSAQEAKIMRSIDWTLSITKASLPGTSRSRFVSFLKTYYGRRMAATLQETKSAL